MIGNSTGISIVELWLCKDTFPTFLHREVVAVVNKMLTDKCITCQKISGHACTTTNNSRTKVDKHVIS